MVSISYPRLRFDIKCDKMAAHCRSVLCKRGMLLVLRDNTFKLSPKLGNVSLAATLYFSALKWNFASLVVISIHS